MQQFLCGFSTEESPKDLVKSEDRSRKSEERLCLLRGS